MRWLYLERNDKGQFVKGMNIKDKTNERFGRLTVIGMSDKNLAEKPIGIVCVTVGIK